MYLDEVLDDLRDRDVVFGACRDVAHANDAILLQHNNKVDPGTLQFKEKYDYQSLGQIWSKKKNGSLIHYYSANGSVKSSIPSHHNSRKLNFEH